MDEKTCAYCQQKFRPSRFHPEQTVCVSAECQRRRRADYHKRKLASDPEYLEQCRRSQKKWRDENPGYMKDYLAKRRTPKRSSACDSGLVVELQRLLDLARNNRVFDLKSSGVTIVLVCPEGIARQKNTLALEKNTLAQAKLIVLQGSIRAVLPGRR
jgi:hypothetical protein